MGTQFCFQRSLCIDFLTLIYFWEQNSSTMFWRTHSSELTESWIFLNIPSSCMSFLVLLAWYFKFKRSNSNNLVNFFSVICFVGPCDCLRKKYEWPQTEEETEPFFSLLFLLHPNYSQVLGMSYETKPRQEKYVSL